MPPMLMGPPPIGAFAEAAGDEPELRKIASVFQAKLIVDVDRLVADRALRHGQVPPQQVGHPGRAQVKGICAQIGRRLDEIHSHRLPLRPGQAVPELNLDRSW